VIRTAIRGLLVASAALVAACDGRSADSVDPGAARGEVAAAMQRYQVAARAVNADSIAAFYTTNAMLFEPGIKPIQTRDSIRAFIASFPGVRVDVATATPDTIEVFGDKAFLWGSYFERLSFPGQPVSEQHGKFVTEWARQTDGRWLIERFLRIPIPSPPPRK
jgi:uncharacterized protein (TIGR02246 family)